MIEQLKLLEEYLRANKMEHSLQALRAEVLAKYPQGPSTQFLELVQEQPSKKLARSIDFTNRPAEPKQKQKNKGDELIVEGLLGKIAYSSKLLEDENINAKVSKLLDNKIFQKAVKSMFPEAEKLHEPYEPSEQSFDFKDELDEISNFHNDSFPHKNGISQIEMNQEDSSILSQPSLVLQQLNQNQDDAEDFLDDNDLGYYEYSFSEH